MTVMKRDRVSGDGAVTDAAPTRAGRPRSQAPLREGASGREQILDAAGQMFSEAGYQAASTRKIAMAVGVKQASLYYHFANKEEILAGLLSGTVQPSLDFAARLPRTKEPAHVQLYALVYYDVLLLSSGRWNLGALYFLPELRGERFAEFRQNRIQLRRAYSRRIRAGAAAGTFLVESLEVSTSLVFGLAETVIGMRSDGFATDPELPAITAASSLRLLGSDRRSYREAVAKCDQLLLLAPPIPR